jgi:hypothetical protein
VCGCVRRGAPLSLSPAKNKNKRHSSRAANNESCYYTESVSSLLKIHGILSLSPGAQFMFLSAAAAFLCRRRALFMNEAARQ